MAKPTMWSRSGRCGKDGMGKKAGGGSPYTSSWQEDPRWFKGTSGVFIGVSTKIFSRVVH